MFTMHYCTTVGICTIYMILHFMAFEHDYKLHNKQHSFGFKGFLYSIFFRGSMLHKVQFTTILNNNNTVYNDTYSQSLK